MSFTSAVTASTVFGNKRVIFGTYASSGGTTGGTVPTGLANLVYFSSNAATASPSTQTVVSVGSVTLTTAANQTGMWMAVGN